MDHNYYANYKQHVQPGGMAAFLLVAVAVANCMIDGLDGQQQVNNNPQLQIDPGARILTHIPVTVNNNKSTRDIEFQPDISHEDFPRAEVIFPDAQCAPAHQLATNDNLTQAFAALVKMKNSRQREVVMLIVHLNPPPAELTKKKNDGNESTDFAYKTEVLIVQEKLKCAHHAGPNQWCYVSPENPAEHGKLANLDRNCLMLPNCLSLDKLHERTSRHIIRKSTIKPEPAPIHVHINNNPLSGSHTANQSSSMAPGMKHTHSATGISSNGSQDGESLPLSNILADPPHQEHGIVYGASVADFDRIFYIRLGMAQGAVGLFLKGVRKAVNQEKRERKFAKENDKENGYNRFESIEC
ncbi:hypothetical protein BYT27DRAFT_7224461 [Phlegmacium glaucopus]|nr:hypothetical protein BYT27DRAFT_7224461 [Phlegmacium glaucopus]